MNEPTKSHPPVEAGKPAPTIGGSGKDAGPAPPQEKSAAQLTAQAKEICTWLARLSRAYRLYTPNNKLIQEMVDNLTEQFEKYFLKNKELSLQITPTELLVAGEAVYENLDRGQSLAFKLFKDGVRRITFLTGLTREEIVRLLDILGINFESKEYVGEDISTMLWRAELKHITHRIVRGFQDIQDQAASHSDYKLVADKIFSEKIEEQEFAGLSDLLAEGSLEWFFGEGALKEYEERMPDQKAVEDIAREMQLMDVAEIEEESPESASLSSPEEVEKLRDDLLAENNRMETLQIIQSTLSDITSSSGEEIKETVSFVSSALSMAIEKRDMPSYFAIADMLYLLINPKKTPAFNGMEHIRSLLENQLDGMNFLKLCSTIDPDNEKQVAKFVSFLRAMGKDADQEVLELVARVDDEGDRHHLTNLLPGITKGEVTFFLDRFHDRRIHVVRAIVESLKKIGTNPAIEGILRALKHPNADIRLNVVKACSGRFSVKIRAALLTALRDKSSEVRLAVIANLVASGDGTIAEELKRLVLEDDFLYVSLDEKREHMKAIATLGGEDYVPFFRKRVRQWAFRNKASKDEVRIAALEALSVIDHPISRLVVRKASKSANPKLRSLAEEIIKKWEKKASDAEAAHAKT